jgi:hypothetical protein
MEVTARIAKGAASARPSSAPFVLPLFTHGAVINGQTVFLARRKVWSHLKLQGRNIRATLQRFGSDPRVYDGSCDHITSREQRNLVYTHYCFS